MSWENGVQCLSSSVEDPIGFAKNCLSLLEDETLWKTIRTGMSQYIELSSSTSISTQTKKSYLTLKDTPQHEYGQT